ncbi:protein lin-37 homolog isoform X2 [Enhydra lutris kenyoni]|uniref:Protein lin-37 homolog isoform X2 n=1 Tax=Enhydra lutris kenyoni TaxID=391180 RepID=A0A2Y9L3X0_ENHLU|nr:protein lin-37 homolog isoform X2 [Enhydra lutris kenyoni]
MWDSPGTQGFCSSHQLSLPTAPSQHACAWLEAWIRMPFPSPVGYPPALDLGTDSCSLSSSPELEMAKARNQLDAVLQCLLEKSHMDRERLEEEAGKTPSDTHNKDCSIAATGKRPSARFPHQRRKKRREMDDGLAEGGPQRSNTYVIKLFDRSVDLAQFSENTPLYPICRAWMRNSPSVRERERSPSSPLRPLPEDEESSEVTNSKSRDVYKLPPPTAPGPPGDACRSRIPSPLQPETQGTPDDEPSEPEPSPSTLIYRNMQRWKRIRQR